MRISLIGGVIDTLVPDLIAGDLDLICVSLDFPNRNEIVKQPLFDSRHILVADPSHPLARREQVSARDIHGYSWMVLKSDYVGNERISSFFATHGLTPPDITFETTSINSLLHSLRSGEHVAHIPERMLPMATELGLQQISLKETIWETTAGYAYRKAARLTGRCVPSWPSFTNWRAPKTGCREPARRAAESRACPNPCKQANMRRCGLARAPGCARGPDRLQIPHPSKTMAFRAIQQEP